MKDLIIIIFFLFASINLFADAAIEIQEGSVKNWIKYYEQERGMDIPELDSDKEVLVMLILMIMNQTEFNSILAPLGS